MVAAQDISTIAIDAQLLTLDLGDVTKGDYFFIQCQADFKASATSYCNLEISKDSGTATVTSMGASNAKLKQMIIVLSNAIGYPCAVSGIYKVTGTGTLIMELYGNLLSGSGGSAEQRKFQVVWLKKQ